MIKKVKDWRKKKQFSLEKFHSDGEAGAIRHSDETWWLIGDDVKFGAEEFFSGKIIHFQSDEIHVEVEYKYMGVLYNEAVEMNNIEWDVNKKG